MGNRQDRRPQKNRIHYASDAVQILARWTGLEPATTGVTGRYSNQLSYHRANRLPLKQPVKNWWVMTESNRRHSACKADALPTELITHYFRRSAKVHIKPKSVLVRKRYLRRAK